MIIAIYLVVAILGACLGSFTCCQARRWRKKDKNKRSHCESCRRTLRWFENVPIFSWVRQRGRCNHCGKKIGWLEFLCEISGIMIATLLLWRTFSGIFLGEWQALILFAVCLIFMTILGYLTILDILYREVPMSMLWALVLSGVGFFVLREIWFGGSWQVDLINLAAALLVSAGLYLVLYFAGRGKWVGSGDWIVAGAIALVLGDWQLTLGAIIVGNFVGALTGVIMSILHKKIRQFPLLPFLLFGLIFALCFYFDFWAG